MPALTVTANMTEMDASATPTTSSTRRTWDFLETRIFTTELRRRLKQAPRQPVRAAQAARSGDWYSQARLVITMLLVLKQSIPALSLQHGMASQQHVQDAPYALPSNLYTSTPETYPGQLTVPLEASNNP